MDKQSIIKEMIEYYDHRAQWHDDYMSYTNLEDSLKLHAPIIDLISDKIKNKEVLEIGCGTGNWTEILAQFASQVVALDSSQNSLEIARQKLASMQNVKFQKSNIFEYDNFSNKYDTIFAADFYSHVPLKAISPMIVVLKQLIKNFPTEQQLAIQLSGLGGSIKYFNFEYLQRWMVVSETGIKLSNS